jgi:aminoglycoside phosphotransferase (APT) family kinase protein
MDDDERLRLAEYLSAQRGSPTRVLDVRRLSVGHSRAMHRVETDAGTYVVRVEQGGVFGTSSGEEFDLMRGLADAGYPVAPARWYESTGGVLGQPFFVMDFVQGAELADERAMDEATAADFIRVLSELHAIDWAAAGIRPTIVPDSPSDATHLQIDRWADVYRSAVPQPIPLLEEAAAWLHRHSPPLDRVSVVHGDAGPGNVVQADGRIVAVTDWEFAHLGDPAEDWSFCLAMRGARTMPRETWLAMFDQIAGVHFGEETWTYWEAFNLFKGACANTTCLAVFESGVNRAPNMAIIGTVLHRSFLRRLVDVVVPPVST